MDQIKLGNLIQRKRKEKNLTQQELANKLGITDKAVSKWERGISCPDISLLLPISEILDITITELLTGEKENKEDIHKKIIEYSTLEINSNKKKNKVLKRIIFIISITLITIIILFTINHFKEKKEEEQLEKYIQQVEKRLEKINFKSDNPLKSPNWVLTIDNITYVVPTITYKKNKKEGIYKEILSYTDYNDFYKGIILYYDGKEITVHKYKEIIDRVTIIVTIKCDKKGNLIKDKNYTTEEYELYNNNKEEIKDRIQKIQMMWYNLYN